MGGFGLPEGELDQRFLRSVSNCLIPITSKRQRDESPFTSEGRKSRSQQRYASPALIKEDRRGRSQKKNFKTQNSRPSRK